jgi:hypothetical protein
MATDATEHCGSVSAPLFLISGMALFGSAAPVSKLFRAGFEPMLGGLLRVVVGSVQLLLAARRNFSAHIIDPAQGVHIVRHFKIRRELGVRDDARAE